MADQTYTSGLLFTRAYKAVRTCIYDILEKYDLNPSYWSIVGITGESTEGIRLAAVAKMMDVKAPLVTMLANDLIEMGIVSRVPHHSDGRAKLLVLTPHGKKLASKINAELDTEITSLLAGTTKQDIDGFRKTLEIIIMNAEAQRVTA